MAVIVLAGGASRRMGRDKALLVLHGKPLIERVVECVSGLPGEILVVADRADRYSLPGTTGVADEFPGEGPLAGAVSGLRAAGAGAHLLVACDMPFLQPDLMRAMLLRAPGFEAVAGRINGDTLPLCAVYTQAALPIAEQLLSSGERVLRRLPEACRATWLDEEELRAFDPNLLSFRNINTPDDFDSAEANAQRDKVAADPPAGGPGPPGRGTEA